MKKQGTPECPADNTVLNHKPNLDIYCGEYTCASADVWAASNPLPKGYDVGTWRCANGFRGSVSTRCVQSDECGGTLQLSGCVPLQACSPPKLRGRDLCRWNFSDCEERMCSLNLLDIIRSIILQRSLACFFKFERELLHNLHSNFHRSCSHALFHTLNAPHVPYHSTQQCQDVASGGFCDFQCSPPFRGTGRAFCPPDNVDPQTELVSWGFILGGLALAVKQVRITVTYSPLR